MSEESARPDTDPTPDVVERLRETIAAFHRVERRMGEHFDLNPTDTAALELIARMEDATPSKLVTELGLSSGAVTFAVDRLVASGHVVREVNPRDRRSTILRPVRGSVREIVQIMGPVAADLSAHFGRLTEAERRVVLDFLETARSTFVRTGSGA